MTVTHLSLQNEFVHGWGLDFAFRKCVEVVTSGYFSYYIKI